MQTKYKANAIFLSESKTMHYCICMWLMCLRITTCDCNTRILAFLSFEWPLLNSKGSSRALSFTKKLTYTSEKTKAVSAICKLIVAFTDG